MKIFISWSGELSQTVALLLRNWLQNVIQIAQPYVSSEDIEKGSRWFADVDQKLEETQFAIICLTKENMNKPWILFEAGATSRSITQARVTPFLINLTPADLSGPLSQFQATTFNEDDLLKLVKNIANLSEAPQITESLVVRSFEKWWPDLKKNLEEAIETISVDTTSTQDFRSDRDILEELLRTTRSLAQSWWNPYESVLAPDVGPDIDLPIGKYILKRIKLELERRKRMFLVVALEGAREIKLRHDLLSIEFSAEAKHLSDNLSKPESLKLLREVCSQILMTDIEIRIITST